MNTRERDGTAVAPSNGMPSPDTILIGLTGIANDWRWLAAGWHLALGMAIGMLLAGWRPSVRAAGYLLAAPLLSVSGLAWLSGNPFNGVMFTLLAAILARESFRAAYARVRLASPAWMARGAALVAFGATYPHFLRADSPVEYLVASPLGLLPCPTLLVVLGATLACSNLPRRWSAPLTVAAVVYGSIGVFRLGVTLDWGLFIGAALAGAKLLEGEGASRSVRAYPFEHDRPLPGDDLIPDALATLTHAITIHSQPRDVWPWLAQMGAGSRGGWYSYDFLDNGRRPSATRIVPALQAVAIGTLFPALPGVADAFKVLAVRPGRALVLGWSTPEGEPIVTWAFVLEPKGGDATRLITRVRGSQAYRFHGLPRAWSKRVIGVVHFLMQRRQLLGIAARAESAAVAAAGASVLPAAEGHRA
jgi:hypothetical protein